MLHVVCATPLHNQVTSAPPTLALAIRTGFATARGQLVASIMHPRSDQSNTRFSADALKFMLVMLLVGMGLYAWAAVTMSNLGASALYVVAECSCTHQSRHHVSPLQMLHDVDHAH